MEKTTQYGYLVLADISGYTSYLAGVELDHAHEILTDLLETGRQNGFGFVTTYGIWNKSPQCSPILFPSSSCNSG